MRVKDGTDVVKDGADDEKDGIGDEKDGTDVVKDETGDENAGGNVALNTINGITELAPKKF